MMMNKRGNLVTLVSLLLIGVSGSFLAILTQTEVLAQKSRLQPSAESLNLSLLEPQMLPSDGSVITADTVSQEDLAIPSLWWADRQFGGKLLDTWIAYPNEHRIDLVVRRQFWSIQDYFEHYQFVNKMGTIAREYNQDSRYNIRVFNQLGEPLGAYTCDFATSEQSQQSLHCQVDLCEVDNLPLGGVASDFCRIKP